MNDGRSSVGKWSKTKTGKNKRQDQGRSCWSISSRSRSNSSNINGRATQSTPLGRKWVAGGWLVGGSWVVVALRLTTMKAKHCPGLRGPLIQATPASPPLLLSWCVASLSQFFYVFPFVRLLHFFHFLCAFNFAFLSLPRSLADFLRPGRLLQLSDCLVAGQPQLFFGGAERWTLGRNPAAVTGHRSGQMNAIVRVYALLARPTEPSAPLLWAARGPSINPEPLGLQPGNGRPSPPTTHHPPSTTLRPASQ